MALDGLLVDLLLLLSESKLIVIIKHLEHYFLNVAVGFLDLGLLFVVSLEHRAKVVLAVLHLLEPLLHGSLVQNLVSRLHDQLLMEVSTLVDGMHLVSPRLPQGNLIFGGM